MADVLTTTYHPIGGYGAMYGCVSYKYDVEDTYYRVYIYWLGEGLKTTESDASSTYSLQTSATIKGEILVNGSSKASWTATASGTRSGYATYSNYVWFKAGGSNSNYYDVTRTSSSQTVTIRVTYTVSGESAKTGTATFTVGAYNPTYTAASVDNNGTTQIVNSAFGTLKWKGTNGTNNAISRYSVEQEGHTIYEGTGTSCDVGLDYGFNVFTVNATAVYNNPTTEIVITRPQSILLEPCAWVQVGNVWQPIDKIYGQVDGEWELAEPSNPYYVQVDNTWEDIF